MVRRRRGWLGGWRGMVRRMERVVRRLGESG